jgi:hypothetical protein
VDFALIDVVACSVVGIEFEACIAAAFVRAPIIDAAMLTQARIFLALIDVHAFSVVVSVVFEAGLAVATIRPNGIDALSVRWTWSTVLVEFALVDVLAVAVVRRHKSSGTNTSVTPGLVLARLLFPANCFARCTLVDVHTLTAISVQLKTVLTRHRVQAAITAVRVDTSLVASTWISHLALVNIFPKIGWKIKEKSFN